MAFTFRITNPLSEPVHIQFWHNAMVAPGPANTLGTGFHFLFPARQLFVHSTSDPNLPGPYETFSWPFYHDRDLRYPRNWQGWLGFFVAPHAQTDWAAVYDDEADEGLVRIFPHERVPGLKGFGFGGGIPPQEWTDDGSVYAEMHGGLTPTFRDWLEIPGGGIIEWTETWFPIWRIGGVGDASVDGALNLRRVGDAIRAGIFPTHAMEGILALTVDGREMFTQTVRIAPDAPAVVDVPLPAQRPDRARVALELRTLAGDPIMHAEQEMTLR